MDYIHRDHPKFAEYEIELDGKFVSKKKLLEASEKEGWLRYIVRDGVWDEYGDILKHPLTKTFYGRVFIVRTSYVYAEEEFA